jgi:hypothetical protein
MSCARSIEWMGVMNAYKGLVGKAEHDYMGRASIDGSII